MSLIISLDEVNPSIGVFVAGQFVDDSSVKIEWVKGGGTTAKLDNSTITTAPSILRLLLPMSSKLNPQGPLEKSEVDHWLSWASDKLKSPTPTPEDLSHLNQFLGKNKSFVVGSKLTVADLALIDSILANKQQLEEYVHIKEWSKLVIQSIVSIKLPENIMKVLGVTTSGVESGGGDGRAPSPQKKAKGASNTNWRDKKAKKDKVNEEAAPKPEVKEKIKDEGKFIDLPGAEKGKVVVRFPPEASGYLHIGHAKAALLNYHYKNYFEGKLILRFDDTNPAKENVEFEKVIMEDMKLLQIEYDQLTYTSDSFPIMIEYCERLLKEGKAYVDDTDGETMKAEREARTHSKNRDNSVEKNFGMWEEMKKGSVLGQLCCVRAKMDMSSNNGCLRDPTIYRCKDEPHPRTDKYKVYPTYDFACPIVDSIEGVTHALRTTEYHDRDDQYFWFIDALGLRKPYIYEYSRLNMMNTVLSKRKLTWFVDEKLVDGWDDPRFPTVRGILRRGLTVQGLKDFIIAQGSSRSVVMMEWDKIWAFNKKVIDPVAPRHTALTKNALTLVNVKNAREMPETCPAHPKNPAIGSRNYYTSTRVWVETEDAALFKEGENVTFMNWGNLMINKVVREGDQITSIEASTNLKDVDYKKTIKVTWLADTKKYPLVQIRAEYYDHLITKPVLAKDEDFKKYIAKNTKRSEEFVGDADLAKLKVGDIIQIQRKGFFICDEPYHERSKFSSVESPLVLIYIPDKAPPSVLPTNSKQVKQADNKASKGGPIPVQEEIITQKSAYICGSEKEAHLRGLVDDLGAKIRGLKGSKAPKEAIDKEVKVLLDLKAQYKAETGKDFTPTPPGGQAQPVPSKSAMNASNGGDEDAERAKVDAQGAKIRDLKGAKAGKEVIDKEVKILLELKAKYKEVTGKDYVPTPQAAPEKKPEPKPVEEPCCVPKKAYVCGHEAIRKEVDDQGAKIRDLKGAKAGKDVIEKEVRTLLELKAKFKEVTGEDYVPSSVPRDSGKKKETPQPQGKGKEPSQPQGKQGKKDKNKPRQEKQPEKPQSQEGGSSGLKKITKLGMEISKSENLAEWYSQVITKSEMIEYYDVSGCYIFRPWSFAIWEAIQHWFDAEIKKLGVQNCYFPMFVSQAALEKEKKHIADFAPEVAWVTKSGDSELAEPVAIRPTSETVMYPSYAKWVQSYRDLPLKLNQWNSVVRWEFKHPQPFIRTREFLWQEGHTAFATLPEAEEEVLKILDLYEQVYSYLLAIPTVPGRKTEKEKFPGGDYTTTVEAFVASSGRGLQGATSHHLGQNFSKMFEIVFEDPESGDKKYVYQNSWGLSTRTIGAMIIIHSDDQGLVLPPRVAAIQVVIIPCGMTVSLGEDERKKLIKTCEEYEERLRKVGIKVKGDLRDNYSPGWKFNHWELKGVPIRMELGPRDMKENNYVTVRRDTGEKKVLKQANLESEIQQMLDDIHNSMFNKVKAELDEHMVKTRDFSQFTAELDKKNIILSPFCGGVECEDAIKKDSARDEPAEPGAPAMGAKSLCIPFKQPEKITPDMKCIHPSCKAKPQFWTLFGRSY